ncbi:MAG: hypothetical protein M1821_005979 [Bathelium mastoideum]|nr:MAG: hypothetical protein M1821_005979 [Bathelium mastoideum]
MRNLKNIGCFVSEIGGTTAATWDVSTNSIICAKGPSGPENGPAVITLQRIHYFPDCEVNVSEITSWDVDGPLPQPNQDKILSLHFLSDIATICLILTGGDIYIIREQPEPGQERVEIVGSVDAGITAAAWSPDEELLAISTGADTLIFMTREFEEIINVSFSPEDLKLSKHVSVGWGKSETQFKGKRAKALRDPTVPEYVDEGILSSDDRGQTSISWRGDGAYVAINAIEAGKRRIIRVYSREGVLDSVSEPVDRLESSLSWRPEGSLIAGVQRLEDRARVVFFERNGLRHGEYDLRLTQAELEDWGSVISLRWNVDSTVLAVSFLDRIQLWTMGNYHYYLKQEIYFSSAGSISDDLSSVEVSWHPEQPLRLSLCTIATEMDLNYAFTTAGGTTSAPNDHGLVSVIDGCNLKITPLRKANIPPPMALHEVPLLHNVADLAANHDGTAIAILDQWQLTLLKYDGKASEYSVAAHYDIPHGPGGRLFARQSAFQEDSSIVMLFHSEKSHKDIICKVSISGDNIAIAAQLELPFAAVCLTSGSDHGSVFVESASGSVYEIKNERSELQGTKAINGAAVNGSGVSIHEILKVPPWPRSCPRIEVWQSGSRRIVFGLTANGSLYYAEPKNEGSKHQLAHSCTSFLVTQVHLLFTTSQHLLKFVHLGAGYELEVPPDEPEKDERCRSIERGAQLVTVMPSSYAVVLQMPRGNLETIYPRALVLAGIRKSIIGKEYKKAFLACRNQRVDMNILHDYDSQQFMANVLLFVQQIRKVEYIDLFLSQLKEDDVCQTLYKDTLKYSVPVEASPNIMDIAERVPQENVSPVEKSKVNQICDAFLQALNGLHGSHLQNIITAHVCKSPPDLDAGLTLIGRLREQGDESVERAVEHICFLADVNQLYNHALGLYDLDLTLLVAQQSQKDPREYLPYLQGLQEQSELRRKFIIDNDLGRWTKALKHLHALGAFGELTAYTEKHELYSQALQLYRYDSNHFNSLMRLYADFLSSHNHFKEAGIAYEYLADHSSASSAYRAANLWRESLSSASLVPLPPTELTALSRRLADGLVEAKDFAAAATIHRDYLGDPADAARLLCRGAHFAEAIRVLTLPAHGNPAGGAHVQEQLVEIVDAGLIEYAGTTTELLADCTTQLAAQVPRLRTLRAAKAADPLAFMGESAADGMPDDVSIAPTDASTTGGTFLTRYTGKTRGTAGTGATRRSSKNRRREERKRAAGKRGTVYEEEYLVGSVRRLMERVEGVQEEVGRLVEGLVRRGMRERARAVEEAMVEVVRRCRESVGEVFETEDRGGAGNVEKQRGEGEYRPAGGEGVVWEAMEQAWKRQEPPVIKEFERLSLVG